MSDAPGKTVMANYLVLILPGGKVGGRLAPVTKNNPQRNRSPKKKQRKVFQILIIVIGRFLKKEKERKESNERPNRLFLS